MTLDNIVTKLQHLYHNKEALADTIGKVTYSIAVGIPLDYFKAGLTGMGIVSSRATATIFNLFTGHPYGKWREGWYHLTKTTDASGPFRKGLVELGALNTFETYIYGIGICIGSLFQKGEINYWDVQQGMEGLIVLSPVIGPTLGYWMDATRQLFGVRKAAEHS